MTTVVWKFPIDDPVTATIKGTPLYIGLDPRTQIPAIWCLCDPKSNEAPRQMPYVAVATGEPLPSEAGRYVTTVTGINGWIVIHFFERLEKHPL